MVDSVSTYKSPCACAQGLRRISISMKIHIIIIAPDSFSVNKSQEPTNGSLTLPFSPF